MKVEHQCRCPELNQITPGCWSCEPDDFCRALVEDGLEEGYDIIIGKDFVRWCNP